MGSSRSQQHHSNPKMLLKNFCDDDGLLWMGERTGGEIKHIAPKKAFIINDLNTSYIFPRGPRNEEEFRGSIKKSDQYERILSQIESEAAPVVQRVIEQARHKRFPQLSGEDDKKLKRFILAMARRTPESQKRIAADKDANDVVWSILEMEAEKGNIPELPGRDVFDRDPFVAEVKKKVIASASAKYAAGDHPRERDREEQFCRETGLYFAVICMPKREFVIGSHGLAIVQSTYGNDPAEGCWLPIAHDVAVKPTSFPDREYLLPLDRSYDRIIKSINNASTAQSQRIAARSKALVYALIKEWQKKNAV